MLHVKTVACWEIRCEGFRGEGSGLSVGILYIGRPWYDIYY